MRLKKSVRRQRYHIELHLMTYWSMVQGTWYQRIWEALSAHIGSASQCTCSPIFTHANMYFDAHFHVHGRIYAWKQCSSVFLFSAWIQWTTLEAQICSWTWNAKNKQEISYHMVHIFECCDARACEGGNLPSLYIVYGYSSSCPQPKASCIWLELIMELFQN